MNIYAYYFLIFIIYSFVGWICEVIVALFQYKRFINRGFLIGPLCPIYGIGSIFILTALGKYSNDPLVLFLLAIFSCAVLEYFTSWIMEKIFKNRWWDYSYMKYNINGRICLEFACAFGVGGIFLTYLAHPFLLSIFELINNNVLNITAIILAIMFLIDFIVSFNIIFKLKNISSTIRTDSTEVITKKVKEILKNNILLKRLLDSFPDMQIYNKLTVLKRRLDKDKLELKAEKKKRRSKLFK